MYHIWDTGTRGARPPCVRDLSSSFFVVVVVAFSQMGEMVAHCEIWGHGNAPRLGFPYSSSRKCGVLVQLWSLFSFFALRRVPSTPDSSNLVQI